MNFIEDVLERFAASTPALLAISRDGERRIWHFGELIAMSAGLSGALAARGVRRGDVVMTLVGNRLEWVLAMLASWRMGAVVLPCNTQLRRRDLELRATAANPVLCIGDEDLLGELPDAIPYMTLAEVAADLDEDTPQEPPAAVADLAPTDPAPPASRARRFIPSATCRGSARRPSAGSGHARATWSGALPPPAGRSRRETSSSPPGCAGRRRCSSMGASTPPSGSS